MKKERSASSRKLIIKRRFAIGSEDRVLQMQIRSEHDFLMSNVRKMTRRADDKHCSLASRPQRVFKAAP